MASPSERQIAHDLMAALNAHDLERFEQLVAPDYQGTDLSRERACQGPQPFRDELAAWLLAFPDLQLVARDVLVEPPRVLVCGTMQGTHQEQFLHVPPTNRPIALDGFSLLTIEEGVVAHGLHLWDMGRRCCGP